MTQEEFDALKPGDVIYMMWCARGTTLMGVVVEQVMRGPDAIVLQRADLQRTSLYTGASARGMLHTTPEKCRDAMVAEIKAEADSHQASADALYKKAEKAARRSYTVLHVPPRDGVMLRPEKRPKTKAKKESP